MANAKMLTDYLFMQGVLQKRVEVELKALDMPVGGIQELGEATEANLVRSTVFVMWQGDRFGDTAEGGRSQLLHQQWLILLAHVNARQDRNAHNDSAGPTLSALHKAIAGWTPPDAFKPFRRVQGIRPSYRPGKAALYPLTFEIPLTL